MGRGAKIYGKCWSSVLVFRGMRCGVADFLLLAYADCWEAVALVVVVVCDLVVEDVEVFGVDVFDADFGGLPLLGRGVVVPGVFLVLGVADRLFGGLPRRLGAGDGSIPGAKSSSSCADDGLVMTGSSSIIMSSSSMSSFWRSTSLNIASSLSELYVSFLLAVRRELRRASVFDV